MTQIGQNMMLVNSAFRNAKSFTLIPVSIDSPYVEAMFDPSSGVLAVISKVMKQSYHMVPKLDDTGQPVRLKAPNTKHCLLYTSPSPRDRQKSRMPSSA